MRESASAIVGIGMTDISRESGRSTLQLSVEATRTALDDAGLEPRDVDGFVTFALQDSDPAMALPTALGIQDPGLMLDWGEGGGNVASGVIGIADAAIRAGMADTVVVYRSLNGRSGNRLGGMGQPIDSTGSREFMTPTGWTTYPQMVAMWARRHMEVYGTTSDHLAAVAIKSRRHAMDNERARMREPLDYDKYMSSPMVCDPFRLYDICLESDGGCAIVLTRADRARELKQHPVLVLGASHGGTGTPGRDLADISAHSDLVRNFGYGIRERLYGQAGISPSDIDVAEIYDCFTMSVILSLEGFGLVEPGEGGPWVTQPDAFSIGGQLPVNTHGGLLSEGYLHGLNHVFEATSQLRGNCGVRQVEDAEVALVTSGAMATGSAVVLGRA